jgi:N6-L-threonylcarbamoyladenine synthase
MSFSGLKTAILRARDDVISKHGGLPTQARADLCAGFQAAVTDVLVAKSRKALTAARTISPNVTTLAVAGGVAANVQIRSALKQFCGETDTEFVAPPLALCTDNAAMIAYAGLLRFTDGMTDDLTLSARPRWPLDQKSAALTGSGKKGAKS